MAVAYVPFGGRKQYLSDVEKQNAAVQQADIQNKMAAIRIAQDVANATAGRQLTASEGAANRGLTVSEGAANRGFNASQAVDERAFRSGEATADRTFRSDLAQQELGSRERLASAQMAESRSLADRSYELQRLGFDRETANDIARIDIERERLGMAKEQSKVQSAETQRRAEMDRLGMLGSTAGALMSAGAAMNDPEAIAKANEMYASIEAALNPSGNAPEQTAGGAPSRSQQIAAERQQRTMTSIIDTAWKEAGNVPALPTPNPRAPEDVRRTQEEFFLNRAGGRSIPIARAMADVIIAEAEKLRQPMTRAEALVLAYQRIGAEMGGERGMAAVEPYIRNLQGQ